MFGRREIWIGDQYGRMCIGCMGGDRCGNLMEWMEVRGMGRDRDWTI